MDKKIHKFDLTLKRLIDETGYKHIALESQEGERIVSYNPAKTTTKNKWDEIRRRLNVLPDGFYKVLATTALGGKNKPDIFMIQKGNPAQEDLKEDKPQTIYLPAPKSKDELSRESILSLPEALKRIEELSALRVEVENLKMKVKDQEEYIQELEDEAETFASKPLEENSNSIQSWAEKTIPTVTPFIEEYFKTKNRQLDLQEKMLRRRPAKKPIVIKTNRRQREPENTFMTMDINDQNQLNQLFDELDVLSDDKFNEAFDHISNNRPELANIIANEFELQEEGEND